MASRNALKKLYKLYIYNIPWTVGQKEFKNYFIRFDPTIRASVIFDKNTGLNSHGIVEVESEATVNKLLYATKTDMLEGRKLVIKNFKDSK